MIIPLVDLQDQYQSIKDELQISINQVLEKCNFIQGPSVRLFEKEFASFCGEQLYCASCGSGTDALYLTIRALGIGKGDEVIVPSLTFIGSSEAISLNGARPVFVDVDPNTYNLDPNAVEAAVTTNTKAIIAVHLYGQPAEMQQLKVIARTHSLTLIEDAAQAHAAKYNGTRTGGLADVACFSFFPGKNLGCYGDGGAVVSHNQELIQEVLQLANHGRSEKYLHEKEGINSRLDAIQAEVLRVKLKYLQQWTELRNSLAQYYLSHLEGVILPKILPNVFSAWHLFVIRIKNRDKILKEMHAKGIKVGIHYPLPLHLQPAYAHLGYVKGDFLNTEKVSEEILSLPLFPEMKRSQQEKVIEELHKLLPLYA